MKVDQVRDFVERVVWTFFQAFIGTVCATAATVGIEWKTVVYSALIAGGLAAGKVVAAQNLGSSPLGDALPGGSVLQQSTGTVVSPVPTGGATGGAASRTRHYRSSEDELESQLTARGARVVHREDSPEGGRDSGL